MNPPAPEPKRVLQLFSREAQELWKDTTPLQRLEWLDFAIYAAWAGAAHRETPLDPPFPKGEVY